MSMVQWWNNTDRENVSTGRKTCHSETLCSTKPHVDSAGIEPGPSSIPGQSKWQVFRIFFTKYPDWGFSLLFPQL